MGLDIHLADITVPGLAYICLGGFVVVFSTMSLLVKEKLYINEVVLGTAFGIVMGPYVFDIFEPRSWGAKNNAITLEVMRVVLATGLFAIGVELPQSYMAKHFKGLLVMVVPTMAFGWAVVAAVIRVLFPNLTYISCLVVAACLTPTDPIICATIVGGKYAIKHVPVNLRQILSAESAANDGLAYPFLSISIYLITETSRRTAITKWFLVGWLYQVIFGTILGALLGIAFSHVMKYSHRKGFIDRESYVAQYLALTFFTIGIASTIGTDDLLAAFAAGTAISWDGNFNDHTEDEVFSLVIDLLLNCACFIYIGAWLPFAAFNTPELGITPWRLVILFVAIIVLRRIPSLLLLFKWIPEINGWQEALFSGHFGPMGVGAVFISSLALTRLPTPNDPPRNEQERLAAMLQPITAFVVLGSIFLHGLSIPFFTIGRQVHSRTVSLSATLTTRSRAAEPPDWLLWARRSITIPREPEASTVVVSEADVERLAQETATSKEAGDLTADPTAVMRNDITEDVVAQTHEEGSKSTILSDESDPQAISTEINQEQAESNSQNDIASAADAQGLGRVQSKSVHFTASEASLSTILSDESDPVSPEINQVESNSQDPTASAADAQALDRVQSKTVHFPSSE